MSELGAPRTPAELSAFLAELVRERWAGLDQQLGRARAELADLGGLGFRAVFASLPRRLGALAQEPVDVRALALPPVRPHWTLTDLARAALLAAAFEGLPSAEQEPGLLRLFESGELGEQVSLLRTLGLWQEPERLLEIAVQACRTNTKLVFEAIVCENAFMVQHFPELSFNQAVLKAIFMDVSVRRIEGLPQRITPELQRMAAAYASERRAAGRAVPIDTDYLVHYGA